MTDSTMLYHGLPAVLVNSHWVLISAAFDQVAQVTPDKIEDPQIHQQLTAAGFFIPPSKDDQPEVSLATLITTSDCNLCCGYCFANSGVTRRDMSEEIAFAAVRRALANAKGRKLSLAFFGGEPTLTQALIRTTVIYARQMAQNSQVTGIEFSITTNGVMPSGFLDYLIRENFLVTLSADGAPRVQDVQRPTKCGGKSSETVERSIRTLAGAGKEFKIRATVTDFSAPHMVEMVDWVADLGGKLVHFEPLSLAGRALVTKGSGMTRPPAEVFAENLKAAIQRGNRVGVGILNSSFMNMATPPAEFCEGNPQHRFAATYDGNITTCVEVQDACHPVAEQFMVGSYDSASDEIVTTKSRERATACQIIQIQQKTDSPCTACFARRICGGGCPVRNFHITGDSGTVDPYRCQLIREMVPYAYELLDEASTGE